jgi:RNA polymerase sigma-70 factor (ECF subfamily)
MKNAGKPCKVHSGGDSRSDAELMGLIARGDREAFAALVRRHQGGLASLFRRLGADAHGAEDCAQETFLRVFRSRERYRASAPFGGFLYRLARHSWVDWSRRAARHRRAGAADVTAVPAESGACVDERLDLEAALRGLPEHLRWVVVLSFEGGLTYAEIGVALDIPMGTVKSRMYHAVRSLRRALHARTS